MDEFDDKLLLLGGPTGELEVVWALVELAAFQDDPLPLTFAKPDAVDALALEALENGELAYVLDDCLQSPMTYGTLRRLILGHGCVDNPFTRSRIWRVMAVRIVHEA